MHKVTGFRPSHQTGIAFGIGVAFVLTAMCYWPSLGGPFLFDDIPNLEIMGDRGGLNSAANYLEFVLSGQSGRLGRPLSLASFALDGQAWPTDPRPFRITNLVIHLVNGLLIFLLTRSIFLAVHKQSTAEKLALLCMTLWLLHPLLVSTTAYVIQRMTQLSCLFTLVGLLSYMHGRKMLRDRPSQGWVWILAGMGVSGILALLSKETGILLPLYALVIEITVFNSMGLAQRHRAALISVLCAPILALLGYMAVNWSATLTGFELRPFTMGERLLTQGVVLLDYLGQIVMPRLSGLGLFHDDFPVSKGIIDPVGTLISLVAIAALVLLAVRWRKTWPFISCGILWFFAGHSLEAGPVALELYFEHRNYLALLGPLIVLCSLLPMLFEKIRSLLPILLILVVGMEGFLTWQSAIPWGSEDQLMRVALIEHPNSLRGQQYVANKFVTHREYSKALAMQEDIAQKFPQHASTKLSILNLRCILNVLTPEQVETTRAFLQHSDYDGQIIGFLSPLIANAATGRCASMSFADVHELFDALLGNQTMTRSDKLRGATHYQKGIAYKTTGNLEMALEQLDFSYAAKPEIDIRLLQVVWLIEAGNAGLAEHYLLLARQHGEGSLLGRSFRSADIDILQHTIRRPRDSEQPGSK